MQNSKTIVQEILWTKTPPLTQASAVWAFSSQQLLMLEEFITNHRSTRAINSLSFNFQFRREYVRKLPRIFGIFWTNLRVLQKAVFFIFLRTNQSLIILLLSTHVRFAHFSTISIVNISVAILRTNASSSPIYTLRYYMEHVRI